MVRAGLRDEEEPDVGLTAERFPFAPFATAPLNQPVRFLCAGAARPSRCHGPRHGHLSPRTSAASLSRSRGVGDACLQTIVLGSGSKQTLIGQIFPTRAATDLANSAIRLRRSAQRRCLVPTAITKADELRWDNTRDQTNLWPKRTRKAGRVNTVREGWRRTNPQYLPDDKSASWDQAAP